MTLPSDNYDLLLLADWLEEYGTTYDIVKSTAIRNNNYNLNYKDLCHDGYSYGRGDGNGFGNGWGGCWTTGSGGSIRYGYGNGTTGKCND